MEWLRILKYQYWLCLHLKWATQIKNDGVYVKLFPFHLKYKFYSWEQLSKSYVRKYNPISEYGGWGYRIGIFGKGKAFNISVNMGLQLELNNKSKIFIGTRKAEELKSVLLNISQYKE